MMSVLERPIRLGLVGLASLALMTQPLLGQAQTRPAPRPSPAANRPTTLPSYPNRPSLERPPRPSIPSRPNRPRPPRPPITTLPSYPDRPSLERPRPVRPPVRPPYYRPGQSIYWGYRYPVGGRYFADRIRCESFGGRHRNCYVRTRGRVVLERRHNGRCRYGNGWGYDSSRIWVRNNCRATFAYGVGSYIPRYRSDGNDAALIIGGVAVAAGLVAILSNSGSGSSSKASSFPPQGSAAIDADLADVSASARPALRQCLDKAAANVGATGGTRITLKDVTIDDLGSGTYRYDVDVSARYPDRSRQLVFNCTANSSAVEDFDFVTEG